MKRFIVTGILLATIIVLTVMACNGYATVYDTPELTTNNKFEIISRKNLTVKNIPLVQVPVLEWKDYYGSIKPEGSVFSIKSGKWNGMLQIDFIDPYSYSEQPVTMIIIDNREPEIAREICNFKDPDGTSEFYYTWGANISMPEPNTYYTVIFRNFTGKEVKFKAKAW